MIGGLGTSEIILIAVAILVLFGAKKLPEIGKSLGKGLKEFKKATSEITNPLTEDYDMKPDEKVVQHPPVQTIEKSTEPAKQDSGKKSETQEVKQA